jgi:hypothetical protein
MSRLVRTLFAVALLASVASAASAYDKYPPGPSYRPCGIPPLTDSVTIFQVQRADTTINPCYPALNDTILGMKGIITGFRLRSTGRAYIEKSDASDYNAVQVYTAGATHLEVSGFARGDEVSVCGVQQVYQAETQIQGSLGTSLTVRKISSGNPLPAARVGTTSNFKWRPATGTWITNGSAFETCDPAEGMLVRVEGPLKVARTQAGDGLFAGTNWLLVNENGSAPGDSICIDGYTLTASNISAPPLGKRVDWVQGILRRATNSGVDCWIVSLRDANDQQVLSSPNLAEAFPIDEVVGSPSTLTLRLLFDANVDVTTAQNPANYTMGSELSGSDVTAATVVGGTGTVVDLTVTEVLPHLGLPYPPTPESVMSEGIGSQSCSTCLSPQQTMYFYPGVASIAEVQAPLADSLGGTPCLDKSRFAGGGSAWAGRISVRGVYLQKYPSTNTLYFMEDLAGGPRSGVAAYNIPFGVTVGHEYVYACRVQEFYGMTELANPAYIIDKGAVTVPAPQLQTVAVLSDAGCDATQSVANAEDYEGVLVRVENVKVVPFNTDPVLPSQGGSFRVVALPAVADTILVSAIGNTYPTFTPVVNHLMNVNGVLNIDTNVPRIQPRSVADLEDLGLLGVPVTSAAPAKITFSVGPSPARITNVRFALPRQADVDLSVFDLSGRRIVTLAKGSMPAKSYEYKWDGTGEGAGVYFVRLRVGSETYNLRTVSLK